MNITTDYDSQLNESKHLKWLPFIGKDFKNSEQRILFIGESHYYDKTDAHQVKIVSQRDFTRLIVQDMAVLELSYGSALYKNLNKVFSPKSKEELWNKSAYMNIIQKPMDTINERPQPKDFVIGWEAVEHVINVLEPTIIIVLGVEAAHHLAAYQKKAGLKITPIVQVEKINGTYYRTSNLRDIPIHFLKHPSKFFSPDLWRNALIKNNVIKP